EHNYAHSACPSSQPGKAELMIYFRFIPAMALLIVLSLAAAFGQAISSPLNTSSRYLDPAQGASSNDLIRRALTSNAEFAAARLDIERARARVRQASLRPNPTVEFEQATGKFTGSAGERETSIGFALPLELNGQRQK